MLKSDRMAKDFESYVVSSILANNEFGIKEVKEMEGIRTMILNRQHYPEIVELIKQNNFNTIQNLPENSIRTSEYLSIMRFADQSGKKYAVTVYDSDDLFQDPQVIDIFPLP